MEAVGRQRSKGQLSHCRNGHPYDEENTLWHANGTKSCRVCRRVAVMKQRRKAKPVTELDEAIKEMEKSVMALALELPQDVWHEVRRRWFDLKEALGNDRSTP